VIYSSPLTLKVGKVDTLTDTLRRFRLEPADGSLLPPAPPAAHLTFNLPVDGKVLINSYTVVSPTLERHHYEIVVRKSRTSRGGSKFMHEVVAEGYVLTASPPISNFPLQSQARKFVFISAGIGVTPIASLLAAKKDNLDNVEVHAISKPGDRQAIETLLADYSGADVHFYSGRNDVELKRVLADQPLGTHVYACAPFRLMTEVQSVAAEIGYPQSNIHLESFGAARGNPFEVHIANYNKKICVGPYESMLEALEREQIDAPYSCRGGACGECVADLIDGEVDHRDYFLRQDQHKHCMTPCVSRAAGRSITVSVRERKGA